MKEFVNNELISNLPIFSEFEPGELDLLKKYFMLKIYKKDEIIKNDNKKELYFILTGKIISTIILPGNIERKNIEFSDGDFFGEMSFFGFKSPFDTYHTKEISKVLSINEKNFIEIIENNSNIAIKFISQAISLTIKKLRNSSKFLSDIVQWGENASRRVITDELTGVYNRSFLEDAVENFFNISKSNNKSLSLLMIDIDNFRIINDTFNYEIGNEILKELVNLIQESISKYGIIGRYGGDEFSILLPETNLIKAKEIAEQIQKDIIAQNPSNYFYNKKIPVTISIGISSFPDTATELDEFKVKADKSLYKAKESGKNTISY